MVGKKQLQKILHNCINVHGITDTATVLDDIKALGFQYSTKGALTVSVSDVVVPEQKQALLHEAEQEVEKIVRNYRRGFLTDKERHTRVIQIWTDTINKLTDMLMDALGKDNNIYMMIDSGARGSKDQLKQMSAMRGLMATPQGDIIELPIKSCFKEGPAAEAGG